MPAAASREGAMSGKDKAEQAKGDLKQAGEHVKDVFKD